MIEYSASCVHAHVRMFSIFCVCAILHCINIVLKLRESGYTYGNLFKFRSNSTARLTFCNIYVIYMLMIIHVISKVDVIMLPVPRLCPY